MRLDSMMMGIARLLEFTPSRSEIRAAKAEFSHVPPVSLASLTDALIQERKMLSENEKNVVIESLNTLLLSAVNYRVKMTVVSCRIDRTGYCYYVCPRCDMTLSRDYQAYCDRCGQHLGWQSIGSIRIQRPR